MNERICLSCESGEQIRAWLSAEKFRLCHRAVIAKNDNLGAITITSLTIIIIKAGKINAVTFFA